MSKLAIILFGTVGIIGTTIIPPQFPVAAQIRTTPRTNKTNKTCIDPLPAAKRVELTLKADKKVIKDNRTIFEPISGKASVKPGDIIKYTVIARNNSICPIVNLVLKQPIPRGTNYLKDSALSIDGAQLLFSIDGGKTFSAKPKIGTQEAPSSDYNYLRWKFLGPLSTNSQVRTTYKLQVK